MGMKVLMCSDKNQYVNRPGGPEFQFFGEENLKKLYELFDEVVWNETGRKFTKEELIENVRDCDAVITCWGSNMFDKEVLDNAPKLKIIAHLCGSVANIVNEDTYKKGVLVIGANDMQFAESVAEAALLYSIAKLRKTKLFLIKLYKMLIIHNKYVKL
jgi:phosphoglycerate dehydrogenase-like enzyme